LEHEGAGAAAVVAHVSEVNPHPQYQAALVSGTSIKTINGESVLGSGNLETSGIPVGAVAYFAMASAPAGWLKANGAAVSRTVYAALFSAIGETYGAGDGSTTFNLPDLRAEFIRGWDDGRGIDTARAFGSAQSGAIESHAHGIGQAQTSGSNFAYNERTIFPDNIAGSTLFSTATGGAETRPRNVAMLACIKY
jgi:phage-related tail fiber protein